MYTRSQTHFGDINQTHIQSSAVITGHQSQLSEGDFMGCIRFSLCSPLSS